MDPEALEQLLAELRDWIMFPDAAQQYRAHKVYMLIRDGHVDLGDAVREWQALTK